MVLLDSLQETKDNIGARDSTRDIILDRNNEQVLMEENSTIITGDSIGHSWICGSASNSIVGVNLNTEDGQQQVVGSAGRITTVMRVLNPNNTFREHFRDNTFLDTDENNTANWNTTLYRLAMTTATDKKRAYMTMAVSRRIWFDAKICTRATFNADETLWGNDDVKYYLSADDGKEGSWEEVKLGIEHTFATQGNKLKFRVLFSGNGANETYIENIRISYTTT